MIPDKEPVNTWDGNSSNITFDFDFLINSGEELLVLHTDKTGIQNALKLNIDYTIHQTGNADGSYITFPILGSSYKTLAEGEKITLMLNIPIAQTSPYGTSDKLNLKSLEFSLDYIVRLIQMVNRKADRSVKIQEGSSMTPDNLIESIKEAQMNAQNFAKNSEQSAEEAKTSEKQAKNWAIKMDGPVENQEYSSKYNANIAKENADICETKTSELSTNFDKYSRELLKITEDGMNSLSNASNALRNVQITNCILEAPNAAADFSGTTITIKSGLKYLTGSGRNADRTLKNTENTLNGDKTINFAGITNSTDAVVYIYNNTAGYCPLSEVYRTSTKPAGNAASNQVWFDAVNNKVYYSAYQSTDWVETTDFIIVAYLTVAGSTINTLTEELPVELVKKSDLKFLHKIGGLIITLSSTLEDNEIWLEGATVSRTTYAQLFAIYGTTYGAGDGSTTFVLPDCRGRTFWGADSFGYIEAGLPNITGKVSRFFVLNNQPSDGALYGTGLGTSPVGGTGNASFTQIDFDASKSNSIYSNEVKTVQTPSIKVRVKTRYK